ncbi:MAG: ribbon-helix-helix protein, CopG family [Mycobacteriales bacterium]
MATRRTTVAADEEDLAVLAAEARRRHVSMAVVLREAVEWRACEIRQRCVPLRHCPW